MTVLDGEQSIDMPSPEICILNMIFDPFGFVVTLTFDLLMSKSNQFIFVNLVKF